MNTSAGDLELLRQEVATACRVLAARGLAEGHLGHISLRIDEQLLLVRCRGTRERGLAWTTAADVRLITLDGQPGTAGELDGWAVPNELPLQAEVLRRQPEVSAVIHAPPASVVAADLAGLGIRPIVGAFDIPGGEAGRRRSPGLSARRADQDPAARGGDGRRHGDGAGGPTARPRPDQLWEQRGRGSPARRVRRLARAAGPDHRRRGRPAAGPARGGQDRTARPGNRFQPRHGLPARTRPAGRSRGGRISICTADRLTG